LREVGAQHGAEIVLEVAAHVAHGGRDALEQPAGEIVDAEFHG
jgi:hypothetical protein